LADELSSRRRSRIKLFQMGDFSIRPGTLSDAETVILHRRAMFREMGYRDEEAMNRMCEAFRPWLARKMGDNEYLAWFAVDSAGDIASGLGLWLMDWPPHMLGPGPWRANILNVYTRPESRRNGLARRLVETAIDWCRAKGISTVILHASDAGRPLYTSMGFQPSTEMRIVLKLD
jgi:GNAT superfamily N-acetyltransferase